MKEYILPKLKNLQLCTRKKSITKGLPFCNTLGNHKNCPEWRQWKIFRGDTKSGGQVRTTPQTKGKLLQSFKKNTRERNLNDIWRLTGWCGCKIHRRILQDMLPPGTNMRTFFSPNFGRKNIERVRSGYSRDKYSINPIYWVLKRSKIHDRNSINFTPKLTSFSNRFNKWIVAWISQGAYVWKNSLMRLL